MTPPFRPTIQAGLDAFFAGKPTGSSLASHAATASGLHLVYATHPSWPFTPSSTRLTEPLHISVLDASFNPATRAHKALALAPPLLVSQTRATSAYDAHLLLFSAHNADKGRGTSSDASPLQRLEMMYLLARDLESDLGKEANVAVGVVEHPLIMTKSTMTTNFVRSV